MLIDFGIASSELRARLVHAGAACSVLIAAAGSAAAGCLSPVDIQAGGIVVYKCSNVSGAVDPAFTEQQPANQTIILKNDNVTAGSMPVGGGLDARLPGAAVKADARLDDVATDENAPPSLSAPEKKVAKAKSASKTKKDVKRKKRKAVKPKPSKIIHLNKPSLGTRIKSFFGL